MPAKKKVQKKSSKKPAQANKPATRSKETIEHYNAVLIEELKSEFKFVIEHVTGVEDRLTRRMDEKFAKIAQTCDGIQRILGTIEKVEHHDVVLKRLTA